jgi:hypothetical protein
LSFQLDQVVDSLKIRITLHDLPKALTLLIFAKDQDLVGLRVDERVAVRLLLCVIQPDVVVYA